MPKKAIRSNIIIPLIIFCFLLGWLSNTFFFNQSKLLDERAVNLPDTSPSNAFTGGISGTPQLIVDKANTRLETSKKPSHNIENDSDERQLVLARADLLLSDNRYDQGIEYLLENLQDHFNDSEYLAKLSQLYQAKGDLVNAIEYVYQSRIYAYQEQNIHMLDIKQRSIEMMFFNVLKMQKDWQGIVDQFGSYIVREPDKMQYYIYVAEAQKNLGFHQEAIDTLAMVNGGEGLDNQSNVLLQQIAMDRISIPLTKKRGQFIVDVVFNHQYSARMLIDTGASISGVHQDLFNKLSGQDDAVGSMRLNTANGQLDTSSISVSSVAIGPYVTENLTVVQLNMADTVIDGLLGMDFLSRYQFSIDQEQSKLILRMK